MNLVCILILFRCKVKAQEYIEARSFVAKLQKDQRQKTTHGHNLYTLGKHASSHVFSLGFPSARKNNHLFSPSAYERVHLFLFWSQIYFTNKSKFHLFVAKKNLRNQIMHLIKCFARAHFRSKDTHWYHYHSL